MPKCSCKPSLASSGTRSLCALCQRPLVPHTGLCSQGQTQEGHGTFTSQQRRALCSHVACILSITWPSVHSTALGPATHPPPDFLQP